MMTEINLKGPRRTKRNGFSLIELLIVVAIILIIAAIAIPNFLHARIAANESTAVSSIHAINTSEIAYSSANPIIGYSATLADLGPANSGYLDAILASGTRSGYAFTYVQDTSSQPSVAYTVNGDPVTRGTTGQRSFWSSQVNVTHYNMTTVATATDPIIQ